MFHGVLHFRRVQSARRGAWKAAIYRARRCRVLPAGEQDRGSETSGAGRSRTKGDPQVRKKLGAPTNESEPKPTSIYL